MVTSLDDPSPAETCVAHGMQRVSYEGQAGAGRRIPLPHSPTGPEQRPPSGSSPNVVARNFASGQRRR